MKFHQVTIVDAKTCESHHINCYGKLSTVIINNKVHKCIINEYDVPVFIGTYNMIWH